MTIAEFAVWFLAVFALIRASIIEPPESAKTAREYVSTVRQMKPWHPVYWVVAVVLVVPVFTAWSACRYALHLASLWLAKGLEKVSEITAMKPRESVAVFQPVVWREIRP
ncbi:hypothetical protein [Nonomuraea sp. NPDC050643]|uniref:hypothetical protein n=1 Tax=Nonomuraea sp. NPDC050643 TaxID=3155660 RepID=UPI0033D1D660